MKLPKKPIDAKDMPWSYIGKDALDAAAERLWEVLRHNNIVWNVADDTPEGPYHTQSSRVQTDVQRAVLDMLGNAVPAVLRQRMKELKANGASADELYALCDLAEDLENDHG